MGTRLAVFGIACVAGLAYLLYVPYPDGCDYPLRVKAFFSTIKVLDLLGGLCMNLGWSYATPYKMLERDLSGGIEGVKVRYETFAGVDVAIYEPEGFPNQRPGSAMVYYHGGGWTLGSVASYASITKTFAKKTDMLVVVPEYRLAPEHPFPAAYVDCLEMTKEFMRRASEFNVNPQKIVLAGDSAGGNLATAVSLTLHNPTKKEDERLSNICMAGLIYPGLQISNLVLPSFRQNYRPPLLSPEAVGRFLLSYLGLADHTELLEPVMNNEHMEGFENTDILQRTSSDWVPEKYKQRPYEPAPKREYTSPQKSSMQKYRKKLQQLAGNPALAPLTVDDAALLNLPYTHIMTCEYDVIRDDGIILFERLKSIGKKVTHQHLEFGSHGLLNIYGTIANERFDKEVDKMLDLIKDTVNKC